MISKEAIIMKKNYYVFSLVLVAVFVISIADMSFAEPHERKNRVARWNKHAKRVNNIIVMVPDGMGLADVTAARVFKNGLSGKPMSLETLPVIGYQRTHSADSTVTDSAAAASAWASGEKYNNEEISCHDANTDGICDDDPVETILELCAEKGKTTALVTTAQVTHATPASFGAHVHNRRCGTEIARQYIEETGIDIILGGGIEKNRSTCMLPHTTDEDVNELIIKAQDMYGYNYITTVDELFEMEIAEDTRILGLFSPAGKTPETYRVDPSQTYPEDEPLFSEMVAATLDIVELKRKGFCAVMEGAQVDWANHVNDLPYQLAETLAFDEAVEVVLDWIKSDRKRMRNTLLIVLPDHETGGFAINGPIGEITEQGELVKDGWTTGGHTATDVLIWSQGPGSQYLGRAIDNTDLYKVMVKVLR